MAGLAGAALLADAGFAIEVVERSNAASAEGAGLQVSPNASAVLQRIGVLDALRSEAAEPDAIELHDGQSDRLLSRFELGKETVRRYGLPYLLCARARLRDVLLEAVHARGVPVRFGVGTLPDDEADVIVGADGIGSVVRNRIEGAARPVSTGHSAWRGAVETEGFAATQVWLLPAAHIVAYPTGPKRPVNVVVVLPDAVASENELHRRLAGANPRLRDLLAAAASWTRWPIGAVDPGGRWTDGRHVLVGDAAHAMTPYAAQGAAMALEDAAVLAAALGDRGGPSALEAYERRRRSRVAAVARLAEANRQIYHMSGPLAFARNLAMRAAPQTVLQRRMATIYGWKPPKVQTSVSTQSTISRAPASKARSSARM